MTQKPHFTLLATSFAGGPRPRNTAIILSALWLLLYVAALFTPPLLDDADATHAQAAQHIALTGDLVTLRVDGVRYLEKAPLPYWLVALSFRIFGFNTFAAHLPQAIAVLLLVLLGHRWANQAFGSRTGYYTAIALLTSTGVFLFTRILIPEIWLSLFLATALFAFLKSLGPIAAEPPDTAAKPVILTQPNQEKPVVLSNIGEERKLVILSEARSAQSKDPGDLRPATAAKELFHPERPVFNAATPLKPIAERPALIRRAGPAFYPAVLWISLALAVLTKGLVALVFFFATAFLFLALTGTLNRSTLARLYPIRGLLLFLVIAAPWHILAALHNPATPTHPGFLWFYFWNEHVLRFLGRRIPRDYNKLPGYAFWLQHLVWLFPWSLFLPLGITALTRRLRHQSMTLTSHVPKDYSWTGAVLVVAFYVLLFIFRLALNLDLVGSVVWGSLLFGIAFIFQRRYRARLPPSPFHRIDPQQRTLLLLSLFAAFVLLFFSLSTNQEYYTVPAYLPILLLIAATITRAEQTYSTNPSAVRWVNFAHAAFTVIGAASALALFYGLWTSRHLPFVPDIGDLLAHRAVGNYTLSMSHVFDLTGPSFAALRLPAALAAFAFLLGPITAWMLRTQRRHLAATSAVAFTAALFLVAAHIAFARFAPMLSSQDLAEKVQELADDHRIEPSTQILLFGDQAYGSSIPFYLGHPVQLVEGRSTSMLFGSAFPDSQPVFLTSAQLLDEWGHGPRKILFVPMEERDEVDHLLGPQLVLEETSGKALLTDRPLTP